MPTTVFYAGLLGVSGSKHPCCRFDELFASCRLYPRVPCALCKAIMLSLVTAFSACTQTQLVADVV